MNFLKLTHDKLDLNEINDLVSHEACGGISFFVGTTRDNFEDKKVVSLEYEAYDGMALKSMTQICNEIRDSWNDTQHIAIYHRLGLVPVKEASVIIAVSSPHRKTSLDAVQYAIEALKKNVPVWKKEKYADADGSSEWKENKEYPRDEHTITDIKKIKLSEKKFKIEDCKLVTPDLNVIPKCLVQIRADANELTRRIECFIDNKREEIDLTNIQDFITKPIDSESSCARVDSIMIRNENTKGHLRIRRVKNEYGPQTNTNYRNALDKLMEHRVNNKRQATGLPKGIEERVVNAEDYLNLSPDESKSVFERLKVIENKILHLESVSPEYSHFLDKPAKTKKPMKTTKLTHSIADIDRLIQEYQPLI